MIKVKVLEYTPNPENVVANAARLCYSNLGIEDLFDKYTDEQNQQTIENLMSLGHESPIEHVSFTFGVEGISRTLSHQLVRHRIASYSQQSQRYVKLDQFEYVVPKSIANSKQMIISDDIGVFSSPYSFYETVMETLQEAYDQIITALIKDGMTEKEAIEDARYVFPNACETKVVFTMNARTLLNFFKLRSCNRAQWEIRELSDKMLIECKKIAPNLFKYAGASCMFGKCSEGNMTCGRPRRVSEYE